MAKRHSPAVYRRRRIVVLLAAIAIIALLWWAIAAIAGSGSGSAQSQPTTTGSTAPAVSPDAPVTTTPSVTSEAAPVEQTPTETPTQPPVAACDASTASVTAITDTTEYGEGVLPQLSLALTNVSDAPCIIDVGTATQVYTITSGSDTVWVSTHCQQEPTNEVVQLEPGQHLEAPAIEWVRERSAPETCEQERPAAVGGGSTYNLTVAIGGIESAPVAFVLY